MGLLLLIRHGQASFGAADYDVLSEPGFAQARRVGEALAAEGVTPSFVVDGSMRRQRDTARTLTEAAGWDMPLRTDRRWAEFDHLDVMASHTGLAHELDRRQFQEAFEAATGEWTSGASTQQYAETFAGFVDRVAAGLDEAAGSVGSGETGVVVTSGGVIAVVGGLLVSDPGRRTGVATAWHRLNAVVVNASVTRVLVGDTGVRLLSFNEHAFLDRSQVTYR